jgi:hypothetical protein
MKKAIVTFGIGNHAILLDIARPSFKAFAKRHGYDYFEAGQVGHQRPPAWYKVQCLIDLLKSYDLAVFFGCDLVVVDGRDDFPLAGDWAQALVTHDTQCGDVPNDDMWICKQEMIPWLKRAWALEKYINHGWWEQAALMDLMGYDPSIENFPTYCKDTANTLYQRTKIIPNEWNVHIWDKIQPIHPRIQHATMWPDRKVIMTEWAKQAEVWTNE